MELDTLAITLGVIASALFILGIAGNWYSKWRGFLRKKTRRSGIYGFDAEAGAPFHVQNTPSKWHLYRLLQIVTSIPSLIVLVAAVILISIWVIQCPASR